MSRSARLRAIEALRRPSMALATTAAAMALLPATALADTAIQGEVLSLNSSSVGKVISDSAASGGKALKIWSNGSGSKSVAVAEKSVTLVARARGEQCNGAPRMSVYVDGIRRIDTSVSSNSYATYSASVALAAGTHTIKAAFTNDYKSGSCDRNLIVDSFSLKAAATTTTSTAPAPTPAPTATPTSTPAPAPTSTPAPAPTPAPTPAPDLSGTGSVTPTPSSALRPDFDSAWGTANYSGTAIGPFKASVHRERISIVNDPAGLPRKVAKFSVYDYDTGPTENPRAQLELPRFIDTDEEIWQGLSIFYPSDFPTQVTSSSGGSFITHTSMAAPPHAGTTAVSFGSYGGTYKFGARLSGSGTYGWAVAPQRGVWHDFVIRMKIGSQGFLEMWHNNGSGLVKQKMSNTGPGGTIGTLSADGYRWIGRTNDPTKQTPPLDSRLALYYKKGMYATGGNPLTLYYGPAKWRVRQAADTDSALLATVNPASYGG